MVSARAAFLTYSPLGDWPTSGRHADTPRHATRVARVMGRTGEEGRRVGADRLSQTRDEGKRRKPTRCHGWASPGGSEPELGGDDPEAHQRRQQQQLAAATAGPTGGGVRVLHHEPVLFDAG